MTHSAHAEFDGFKLRKNYAYQPHPFSPSPSVTLSLLYCLSLSAPLSHGPRSSPTHPDHDPSLSPPKTTQTMTHTNQGPSPLKLGPNATSPPSFPMSFAFIFFSFFKFFNSTTLASKLLIIYIIYQIKIKIYF